MLSGQSTTYKEAIYRVIPLSAGALLGLSFVALTFFLVDLIKRYKNTALPVFRERNTKPSTRTKRNPNPPESLTDRELMDGDPVVVFIAFSVAVSWNLFLMPLTIGLSAAVTGIHLWVLAAEMCGFFGLFLFTLRVRNTKIKQLQPYLTREELLWPFFGSIWLLLYGAGTATVLISALPRVLVQGAGRLQYISTTAVAFSWIKGICILSLLLGTYAVNKDMFIFFKAVAAERMREKWLHELFQRRYVPLRNAIEGIRNQIPTEVQEADPLLILWNDGQPPMESAHEYFQKAGPLSHRKMWLEIVNGTSGVPIWMLDIPAIADWVADVEVALAARIQLIEPTAKATSAGRSGAESLN